MNTLATIEISAAHCTSDVLVVKLNDGRTLCVPLAWFPRLLAASPQEREHVELSRRGLHWDALNEDISVAGLLAGAGDQTRAATALAA